jgi:hypothetical protein
MQQKWFSVQAWTNDSIQHWRPHAQANQPSHDRHWQAEDRQTKNGAR